MLHNKFGKYSLLLLFSDMSYEYISQVKIIKSLASQIPLVTSHVVYSM